jgi:ParB family chromosome partitioning protein
MKATPKESRALVRVAVSDVVIGVRHREDMGDMAALRQSIQAVGLIHPITIGPSKQLVAGYRRLTAFKQMARTHIDAVIANDLDDAAARLIAERDENTCREGFTPSEAVNMGKAIEALEEPKSAARKVEGQKRGGKARQSQLDDKLSSSRTRAPMTREKVGAAVGMSGATYQRAKAVVEAAEAEPEKYGALREEMDRTGKVFGVYKKLVGNKPKSKKKKKPSRPFRDGEFLSLCEQLTDWMKRRADRLGGLEDHAECVKLFAEFQRRIELWQEYKPA